MSQYKLHAETIIELNQDIDRLERLLADLYVIRAGALPSKKTLEAAPFITNWRFDRRVARCLTGNISGHSTIGENHWGVTSELWFVDPHFRFVRTLSRYYRLGDPAFASSQNQLH